MEGFASSVIEFLTAHSEWAVVIVALLCFGESLVLIGLFIPATSLMVATGSLLATGKFDSFSIILAAITGSVLGDWVSYIVGQKLGPAVYHRWPLNEHRTAVAQGRLFFRRYGFQAVLIGRFLGPLRSIVPLIAGVTRMPGRSFQLANVISAVFWVPLLFAPGYLSAKHLMAHSEVNEGFLMLAGLGVGIAVAVGGWLVSKLMAARRKYAKARARVQRAMSTSIG